MRAAEVQGGDDQEGFRAWSRNERGWAPKTLKDYSYRVDVAERWAGRPLATFSLEDLKAFLFQCKPTARTRNSTRSALIGFFDFLVATGQRTDNVAMSLPRLPEARLMPKPLPRELVPVYLAVAKEKGAREYALVALYLFTGLRLSEVRWLTWLQVAHEWMCLPQKGGDERVVAMHDEIRLALTTWRNAAPADSRWVFQSPVIPDQPLSKTWLERTVKELGREAGIANVWPHRLRHTFGTNLWQQTRDILLVQKAMGHASVSSTQIYTEVLPLEVAAAVRQLSFEDLGAARERRG